LKPPGERGKHPALDADREQQILNWIQQRAEQSTPVGKTEIMYYCTTQLKVLITRGREFVRSSPFGPNLQNEKYPLRTAAFASTSNVSGENNPGSERTRSGVCG
jgi:hypothetical protein